MPYTSYQDTSAKLNNYLILFFVDDPTHSDVIIKLFTVDFIDLFRLDLRERRLLAHSLISKAAQIFTGGQRSSSGGSGGYTRTLLLGLKSFDALFKLASPKLILNA